jgi:hypothetical protein
VSTPGQSGARRRIRCKGRLAASPRIFCSGVKKRFGAASQREQRLGRMFLRMSIRTCLRLAFIIACCLVAIGADNSNSYAINFEQTALGKPPDDMMILNGVFSVVEIDKNKCLELTADPLEGDGLLFGPKGLTTCTVSARVWGESTGRRFPEFGVGSNDAGGFKLVLVPGQGVLEIRRGDESKASVPCKWKNQTWTQFKLHVAKLGGDKFQIEGRAWPAGEAEPKTWMVSVATDSSPPAGRASIWGMPYSGKPIRFDDLAVAPE